MSVRPLVLTQRVSLSVIEINEALSPHITCNLGEVLTMSLW